MMNPSDIAKLRLHSQCIAKIKHTAAADVVRWVGAMQAQDYAMAKWAVGARLTNATDQTIETAISSRTAILPTDQPNSKEQYRKGGPSI